MLRILYRDMRVSAVVSLASVILSHLLMNIHTVLNYSYTSTSHSWPLPEGLESR